MTTHPAPADPVSSLTRPDGTTEAHSADHGRIIHQWENVMGHGATGDGSTDDSTAIASAATAAGTTGTVFFPPGYTYAIETALTFTCNVQGVGATLNWTGSRPSGAIITLTGTSGETYKYQYRTANLPDLVFGTTVASDHATSSAGTDIGVKIVNAQYSHVSQRKCWNTTTGWLVTNESGSSSGNQYNEYHLPDFQGTVISLDLLPVSNGWTNDNKFYGGVCASYPGISGARCIRIQTGTSKPNNNTFVGTSVESNVDAGEYRVECYGSYNVFLNMRWEGLNTPEVYWGAGATENWIIGGFESWKISHTAAATAAFNKVQSGLWMWLNGIGDPDTDAGAVGGVLVLTGYQHAYDPLITLMPPKTDSLNADPNTDWVAQIRSNAIISRNSSSDADSRFQLTLASGKMEWGDGTNPVDSNLYRSASGTLSTDGIFVAGGANGVYAAKINNTTTINNSSVELTDNGVIAKRNLTDTKPPLSVNNGYGTAGWYVGSGSPETVVTAGIGSIYSDIAGGTSTTLYVKESGTGNTGWVAK